MLGQDPWLQSYEACLSLGQEIRGDINQRNKHPKGSTNYTKDSAHVRAKLRKYTSDLANLRMELIRESRVSHVTPREVERRQGLIDNLASKEKQLDQAFRNDTSDFSSRGALFDDGPGSGFGPSSGGRDPWGEAASGSSMDDMSFGDIRQQQKHIMRQQDDGLDALSAVISRQRAMASDIGTELDTQNELIDDITDHVDRTDQRLIRETKHIKIIDRKSNTCCMWGVIILLFLAIVIIIAIPYHGKP